MDGLESAGDQPDHQRKPAEGEGRLAAAPRRLIGLRQDDEVGVGGEFADLLARAVQQQGVAEAQDRVGQVGVQRSSFAPQGQRDQAEAIAKVEIPQGLALGSGARGDGGFDHARLAALQALAGGGLSHFDLTEVRQGVELAGVGGEDEAVVGLDGLVRRDRQLQLVAARDTEDVESGQLAEPAGAERRADEIRRRRDADHQQSLLQLAQRLQAGVGDCEVRFPGEGLDAVA